LARGYLNRPDLTAERFVPNPFGPPGSRLYRTGDLGRQGPDGQFQFLGRADAEVGVGGYRVDPAEIEALLRRLDGVEDAAVTLHENPQRGLHLVAWLVPGRDGGVEPDKIRLLLASELPEPLVPKRLVTLPELPYNLNGKVDRRRLAREYSERHNPRIQMHVARVWCKLLGVETIGLKDDLIELGGPGLMEQAHTHLQNALSQELHHERLAEHCTIATQSRYLERFLEQGGASEMES
jgi:hypothetical protein